MKARAFVAILVVLAAGVAVLVTVRPVAHEPADLDATPRETDDAMVAMVRAEALERETRASSRAVVGAETPGDDGPSNVVTAIADPPVLRLIGRALDARDRPIAGRFADALLRSSRDGTRMFVRSSAVRADDSGAFEWTLQSPIDEPIEGFLRTTSRGETCFATFATGPLHEGTRDVGVLRFERGPVVALGKVVDTVGGGVAGARVEVVRANDREGHEVSAQSGHPMTAPDGTFAIRATEIETYADGTTMRVALRITHSDFRPTRVPFEWGADVGTVVLSGLGRADGRLVLPDDYPYTILSAVAWPVDAAGVRIASYPSTLPRTRVTHDGRVRIGGLEPGEYEVTLEGDHWVGPPLVLWTGVGLVADGEGVELPERDVRLELASTRIHVLGPNGAAVDRPRVTGASFQIISASFDPTRGIVIPHRTEGGEVFIGADECLEERVDCDGSTRTIALRRRPRVIVHFVAPDGDPLPGTFTATAFHRWPEHVVKLEGSQRRANSTYEAPIAGSWDISARSGSRPTPMRVGSIRVFAEPAVQEVTLELPRAFVE
jgi:hypothetical protein